MGQYLFIITSHQHFSINFHIQQSINRQHATLVHSHGHPRDPRARQPYRRARVAWHFSPSKRHSPRSRKLLRHHKPMHLILLPKWLPLLDSNLAARYGKQ